MADKHPLDVIRAMGRTLENPGTRAPFVPTETADERAEHTIRIYRKHGFYARANAAEEKLAARQNRPPILVPDPAVSFTSAPAKPSPSPSPRQPAQGPIADIPWTDEEIPSSAYAGMVPE